MIVIAILIAVMLDPVVLWLEAHRARKTFSVTAVGFAVFGLLFLFLFALLPAISREIAAVSHQMPQLMQRTANEFPAVAPLLKAPAAFTQNWLVKGFVAGKFAITGLAAVVFVLVVALYLLVEGRTTFAWLVSFAPRKQRPRIDRTAREMSSVVLAYMRGNVITSLICAGFVLVVLAALRIPLLLLLTVIAFVFDFVPVVGTIIMILPAALLGFVISPLRGIIIIAAYLFYHLLENYVIAPRVYGDTMRLSTLTVLLAIAVGGTLQGVIGAVLALPIAAAYPIVERIWLRDRLPPDTVARHEELEKTQT
jgi:predicted PurR-regulated permease PerM